MTHSRRFVLGFSGAAALAFVGMATSQSGNPQRQPGERTMAVERVQDSRMLGVSLARFINDSENDYKIKAGNFATWEELENSAFFQAGKGRWAQTEGVPISSGPEIIPGWHLSLVRSADGASYQFMLQNVPDKECRFSLFSDQNGVIYEGQLINCLAHVVPAHN